MADNSIFPSLADPFNGNDDTDFVQLNERFQNEGVASTLEFLSETFRERRLFPQLFEVRKMQCRLSLQLPLVYDATAEQLGENMQRQLEEGLLTACLEVGLLLWNQGDLMKGWMYLQPVGSRPEVVGALERFPIDDDNLDAIIDIAIGQGMSPPYGYRLLMQKYGTCNAITTYDMQANRFDRPTQKRMAELLLQHVYQELVGNLAHSIGEREVTVHDGRSLSEATLTELIERFPYLAASYGHQLDATHLASVVRIAKLVTDANDVRRAYELTMYGLDLHSDFQYPGLPPFEENYLDHQKWYQAQLGIEVVESIAHFRRKCETVDVERFGGIAYESLAELLFRLERRMEAIDVLVDHVWGKFHPLGVAPNLFQIAQTSDEQNRLQQFFRKRNDLLSYSMSLLGQSQS